MLSFFAMKNRVLKKPPHMSRFLMSVYLRFDCGMCILDDKTSNKNEKHDEQTIKRRREEDP